MSEIVKEISMTEISPEISPDLPSTDLDFAPLEPIPGGFHVKDADDGIHCIDVMQMLYNWRLVLSDAQPGRKRHETLAKGWCYFGHGDDPETGLPRSMAQAFVTAVLAAKAWDGYGEPGGFDKKVGS